MQETQLICSASALNRRVQGLIPGNVSSESHYIINSHNQKTRRSIRHQRRQLRTAQQHSASIKLCRLLTQITHIKAAKHIAIYHANDGEINLSLFIQKHHKRKLLYSPKTNIQQKRLSFHFQSKIKRGLKKHPWGFIEPCNKRKRRIKQLDVIILPLVAFTQQGQRMGMGGGFYDRALSFRNMVTQTPIYKKPILIGVAHDIQKVDLLYQEHWDVPCDFIVTDKRIYRSKLNL